MRIMICLSTIAILALRLLNASNSLEEVFTDIYLRGDWGKNELGEGTSGGGSTVENAKPYVQFLEEFLKTHDIRSVIDVGCGDWQFSRYINWEKVDKYIGYDVVKHLVDRNTYYFANDKISFIHGDALRTDLPKADLFICKEVLQHLNNEEIKMILPQIKKYKYAIIVNDVDKVTMTSNNMQGPSGGYRTIDITKRPFKLKAKRVLSYEAENVLKQVWLIENEML